MEPAKFSLNEKRYLVHDTNHKFWEIINEGSINHIRYGKLKDGVEHDIQSGLSAYESNEEALSRAMTLVISKENKGYIQDHPYLNRLILKSPAKTPVKNRFTSILSEKNLYDGTYLELEHIDKTEYWKVQVSGNSIKIDTGFEGQNSKQTTIKKYSNDEEAAKIAKIKTREKIAVGFKRNENKFIKDFYLLSPNPERNEIIDLTVDEDRPKPVQRKLFQKEIQNLESKTLNIGDLLCSIGLERYIKLFEDERISMDEFLTLNERDLENLNLPAPHRKLILDCISSRDESEASKKIKLN
ncbi:unnamed protein product [Blepharisma stoltei]|uniref:SAM domain-containing protein n=1 Tax=Blepharisma stoltei TaxID=1481888 RepID=A0AAU9JBC3_9CILI|nr:unnamed protein product [Blepharisma stoltei]